MNGQVWSVEVNVQGAVKAGKFELCAFVLN